MRPNAVFVSHSSKTTLAFTEKVVAALKAKGFDPLWDKEEIKGGDVWRRRIADLLAECRAAVILLSPEALASPWVLYEASILSWRHRLDADFKLVPVLVGQVQLKEIEEKGFGPLVLTELQALKENPTTAEKVAALLPAKLCKKTPLNRVIEFLAEELGQSISGARVHRVALEEGISVAWDPQQGQLEVLFEEIARQMFKDGVKGLPRWLEVFGTIKREAAKSLLRILAPFWVPMESAGQLVEQAHTGAHVGINGNPDLAMWTSEMFVRRAWWPSRKELFVDPGTGFDQCIAAEIMKRVREKLVATGQFIYPAEVDKYLADPKPPLYVLLRRIDAATLREMHTKHPKIRFLVHAGESLQSLEQEAYPNLLLLRPALDLNVESSAREAHLTISLILNGDVT